MSTWLYFTAQGHLACTAHLCWPVSGSLAAFKLSARIANVCELVMQPGAHRYHVAALLAGAAAACYLLYRVRTSRNHTSALSSSSKQLIHYTKRSAFSSFPLVSNCFQICRGQSVLSWAWLQCSSNPASKLSMLPPTVDGVLGAIGNTPLIRIASLSQQTGCEVCASQQLQVMQWLCASILRSRQSSCWCHPTCQYPSDLC